jgi:hypothetical protein
VCDVLAKKYGWGYSAPYFNCITDELNKYSAADTLQTRAELPKLALYRVSYASPLWTVSLAGLAVLVCLLLMTAIVVRITIYIFLRLLLVKTTKG